MLTLDDCLQDFNEYNEVLWFINAGITLSATLYQFTFLSPHIALMKGLCSSPRYVKSQLKSILRVMKSRTVDTTAGTDERTSQVWRYPLYIEDFKATLKVMKSGIMSAVAIPDERISQVWRYPVWRDKLRLLPDPAAFNAALMPSRKAKLALGWDPAIPTLLMFGTMYRYKGLDILLEALSERFGHHYNGPLRVVLAGKQVDERKKVTLSPAVEFIEYDCYIEQPFADQLFSAADCVVMPFVKEFDQSSGTFSLACASGKFTIVPNQGILGWRVRKLRNGNVYKPGDPASLAKAISRFVDRYSALSFPIEGSLKYADTCTPSRYVEEIDSIIRESFGTVHYA
jgi:glycosyltransferase involved in cell wall biosynthesis